MIVTGYRSEADFSEATRAISKHLDKTLTESKKISNELRDGGVINLKDDLCLKEDLIDLGFFIE